LGLSSASCIEAEVLGVIKFDGVAEDGKNVLVLYIVLASSSASCGLDAVADAGIVIVSQMVLVWSLPSCIGIEVETGLSHA
jgi:hypothetical protein